ncbi:MAG: Xaa-Pro aminopeptidase [Candidatus Binatota bacterium]|nr:Xaa-Pro aminopeptidase [Candidatus Binatota bacterium]
MEAAIFADRRRRFLDALPEGSLAVFPAAPSAIRSGDTEYPYRPDNDILYLTGFAEPETVCLLDRDTEPHFTLFVRPRDPERETWTGRRFGVEGARERFGAEAAYAIDGFDDVFRKLLDQRRHLFYAFARNETFNQRILDHVRASQASRARTGFAALTIVAPADVLHEMRLRKSAEEVEHMRRAAGITAVAHREAHAATRPGTNEHEVEAVLAFAFRRLGGTGPAYPPIVASGDNATILHYTENSRRMEDGDLLLIDAAAEYEGYCADVTRTFPVGDRFTPEQRAVYDVVLDAQKQAIERIRPGVRFDDVHDAALHVLVDGLRDLGVIDTSREEAIEKLAYRPFYMHRTSHWLGMDVHDVGKYREGEQSRALEPGMVLTVEPGLYFGAGAPAERYAGIGVRIEDDVLVTQSGHDVLTAAIPKDAAAMER